MMRFIFKHGLIANVLKLKKLETFYNINISLIIKPRRFYDNVCWFPTWTHILNNVGSLWHCSLFKYWIHCKLRSTLFPGFKCQIFKMCNHLISDFCLPWTKTILETPKYIMFSCLTLSWQSSAGRKKLIDAAIKYHKIYLLHDDVPPYHWLNNAITYFQMSNSTN